MKTEMSASAKHQTLDIRDYFSPLSVLKVRSLLNKLKDGQMLEVWSNDFETKEILERIIENSNDEWVGIDREGEYEKIYIRRRKDSSRPDPDHSMEPHRPAAGRGKHTSDRHENI